MYRDNGMVYGIHQSLSIYVLHTDNERTSEKVNIVLAAHCFSDDGANSSTISPSNEYYKIAVGKYEKGILMDSEYTQIVVVSYFFLIF